MAYLNEHLGYIDMEMSNYTLLTNATVVSRELQSEEYTSKAQLQKVTLVLAIILIPSFCVLGSIGNILSFVVLFNQRMRNQTNYILAALCVSDTLFLIHSLIYTGLNVYKKMKPLEGEALRAYVYPVIGAYSSVVTARITSCLTTLLCAERFVAVFYPMQARTICSKRNTGIAISIIYITTMIAFIPFGFKYKAVTNYVNENFTFVSMNTTSFFENNEKFYQVYGTALNIIFRFAPLIIIPILNVKMIRTVKMTWKLRRDMSANSDSPKNLNISSSGKHSRSNDQTRITIMLLTVSFVFLICIMPGALNSLATHISDPYGRMGKAKGLYMLISTITFLLETINSSVNFIIYMVLSRKFRLLYKEIFCCGHGEYYRKISLTSVKERFKWSTNRKRSQDSEAEQFRRRTVSDIGPLVKDTKCNDKRKRILNEIHSEGYNAAYHGTAISLEDYVAYHDLLKQQGNGHLKSETSSKQSLKSILFARFNKSDETESLKFENGNDVSCSLSDCDKNFDKNISIPHSSN